MTNPVTVAPTNIKQRRIAELFLLVLAIAISTAGYIAASLGYTNTMPTDLWLVVGACSVLFLTAHLAIRKFAPYADPLLLPLAAFLNLIGLVLIHRLDLADAARAERADRAIPRADAIAQLTWTAVGIILFVAVLVILRDHRILQRFTYTALVLGVTLLILPLLPFIGTSINGARLWLRLGPLSFQPAEMAKLCLIVFLAGYLVVKRDALATARSRVLGVDLPRGRDLGPLLIAWVASMGVLVFQRDLGTALLFFGLFILLLYVATERRSWLLLGSILFVAGAGLAYFAFGHVQQHGIPNRSINVWSSRRWSSRDRTRPGKSPIRALRQNRLHHGHSRRRARPGRVDRHFDDLRRARSTRLSYRGFGTRRLWHFAGRGVVYRHRPSSLHCRWGRDSPHPVDRTNHAFPVLWRFIAGSQLDHHCFACAY